jgi:Holliday junction resolvase-like predicted endonuclease
MTTTIATETLKARSKKTAESFLKDKGYIIVDDWKCGPSNLGFVAKDDDTLVFIEVMCRESHDGVLPYETHQKRRNSLEASAAKYLAQGNRPSSRVRFDIISLIFMGRNQAFLRHHIDALCGIE